MSRTISLFEDTLTKLDLTNQEKKDIQSLEQIISSKNVRVSYDGRVMICHYVGFVQINQTRLMIYPKIAKSAKEEDKLKACNILMNMLIESGYSNIKPVSQSQSIDAHNGDLLELYISLFANELLHQLERDINRGYKRQEVNQSFIKGKIDFPKHIIRNSYRKHLHHISYDEYTDDIHLNRVLKSVVLKLLRTTYSIDNKKKLRKIMQWFEEVEDIKLSDSSWNITFDRLNSKYELSYNMAKLFFYNKSPLLKQGINEIISFLVPLNDLFEYYVYKKLKRENEQVTYQKPQLYLTKDKRFRLKPDIVVHEGSSISRVIDAKYKRVDAKNKNYGVAQSDIYQVLAYATRYECNDICLIYPKYLDQPEPVEKEIEIENTDIKISIKQVDLEN